MLSNLNVCNPGFDLILQDTVFWPGALLGELLDIPIVEVLPLPIMTHKEYEMSFPNPLAYAPQMGLGYTVQMVLTKSSSLLLTIADVKYTYYIACIHAWLATGMHAGHSYHASQVHADRAACAYSLVHMISTSLRNMVGCAVAELLAAYP